ncbi:hypothetical protein ABIB15_002726 [Marisediminicola sp. UYEF4]|uniref:hypothetical protein n=1 Tax=Marisediminicola sp. UYEF4 TaxID=1756384 RepID=UPI003392C473
MVAYDRASKQGRMNGEMFRIMAGAPRQHTIVTAMIVVAAVLFGILAMHTMINSAGRLMFLPLVRVVRIATTRVSLPWTPSLEVLSISRV